MTLTKEGNLGIGTGTPKSLLHINGTSAVSGIATSYVEGGLITANSSKSNEGLGWAWFLLRSTKRYCWTTIDEGKLYSK
jgi:hypothetical protein